MKCIECGGSLRVVGDAHRYDASGLKNVLLRGVEVRECAKCGERETAIPNIEGLHRAIAHVIVRRPSALSAAELRFLRQYLGYSSKDFAAKIGVRAETLSRWENAERPVNELVDRLTRLLVMNREPLTTYDDDFFSKIRPLAQRRPRIEFRLDGQAWSPDRAA